MDPPKIKGRGTIDARVIKDNKSQRGEEGKNTERLDFYRVTEF